ncbi:malate dehydrogenase [Salinivirga cyanobacteriivorans]|uniref:Malate dehydrogenase n=2 Tax=Salinivirga TaxID=1970191 RepID=A0A0S2I315_9BACT|nr:malate dehydrogenase [Salinivirga cyanobacteriivorans]ALO16587.1 Malate dehydrogenase [Salinivirga cyanobacteriivorans]
MRKVSVIGAGNVGATCANVVARKNIVNNVVLLDIKEGVAEGKALDMWQTSSVDFFHTRVHGVTNDYEATKDSEVVVITSGLPRKPGMSRDDLISTNAKIVKEVTENVVKYSPNAIIIVVSNPLDVMAYTAFKTAGLPKERVIGMAGILDSSRYKAFLADELSISPNCIQGLLLGGHGDTMVPLPRYTSVAGIPVQQLIDKDRLDAIIERTRKGGGELVKLMGTSAWYAPGAAAAQMVEAVIDDQQCFYPVAAYLDGEYGLNDLYLGVPIILGRQGIEKIIQIDLNKEERDMLDKSAESVKETLETLKGMNILD